MMTISLTYKTSLEFHGMVHVRKGLPIQTHYERERFVNRLMILMCAFFEILFCLIEHTAAAGTYNLKNRGYQPYQVLEALSCQLCQRRARG